MAELPELLGQLQSKLADDIKKEEAAKSEAANGEAAKSEAVVSAVVDSQNIQQAEELRLEGNAEFSAKKWNGAIKKYKASIALDGSSPASAKVYSNLAAALCKLSKYDDAHVAAKKATEVDPDWAKGHWRLGVVNELQKDFLHSFSSYGKAAELDPTEETFVKAKEKMMKRLGCTEKTDDDGNKSIVVELPPTSITDTDKIPAIVAWERLLKRTNNLSNADQFLPKYWGDTSEHWMQSSLNQWFRGMYPLLGQLADIPHSSHSLTEKVDELKKAVQAGKITMQQYSIARQKVTGVPTAMGKEMDELIGALTSLMGDHIPLESREDGKERFVPSPPWLRYLRPKQMIAIQDLLCRDVLNLKMTGKNNDGMQAYDGRNASHDKELIVISPGLLEMANSFWQGTCGNKSGITAEEGTPEEVVAYIKRRLEEGGVMWDQNNGMRKYVSSVYRGTVLSAWLARVTLGLGVASRNFRWATKFIDLADETWNVTQSGNYSKYGSSFRKSFRVSIMAMELQTSYHNRNFKFTSYNDVLHEFNLAQRIISYAKEQSPPTTTEFHACSFYTSFCRKPMAYALSLLGSCMHSMMTGDMEEQDMLIKVIEESGITDFGRDDSLVSFLVEKTGKDDFTIAEILAETYHVAAQTQLPDDTETAILWWSYSAHICYAGNYKLKDLRRAINKAIVATQQRDDDLWGPSMWRGSAHQKLSLLVARYFEEKKCSFVLPRVDRSRRSDGNLAIFCGDHLICPNFDRVIRLDNERQMSKRANYGDYFDTAEVEQEHGAEADDAGIGQEQSTES